MIHTAIERPVIGDELATQMTEFASRTRPYVPEGSTPVAGYQGYAEQSEAPTMQIPVPVANQGTMMERIARLEATVTGQAGQIRRMVDEHAALSYAHEQFVSEVRTLLAQIGL